MKINDAIGKNRSGKKDNIADKGHSLFAIKLIFFLSVIFLSLLAYVLASLFFNDSKAPENNQDSVVVEPAIQFKDCTILREACSNASDCSYFSLCGDGSYKICKIYDCGETYGVFTQDSEDKPVLQRKLKYDMNVIQAKKDACGNGLQIVEQKCVDGKMQVMVKLSPKGDCKIGIFTLLFEGTGAQPNSFTELQDHNYSITADTCGKITGIIPRTEEGIAIF